MLDGDGGLYGRCAEQVVAARLAGLLAGHCLADGRRGLIDAGEGIELREDRDHRFAVAEFCHEGRRNAGDAAFDREPFLTQDILQKARRFRLLVADFGPVPQFLRDRGRLVEAAVDEVQDVAFGGFEGWGGRKRRRAGESGRGGGQDQELRRHGFLRDFGPLGDEGFTREHGREVGRSRPAAAADFARTSGGLNGAKPSLQPGRGLFKGEQVTIEARSLFIELLKRGQLGLPL